MVVEPGEGRRESLWVKSLVVLLVVFIGVPSGVFVYRKWVDWRVNVEVEKTIESDEVHDLIEKDLRHIDPLAFTPVRCMICLRRVCVVRIRTLSPGMG